MKIVLLMDVDERVETNHSYMLRCCDRCGRPQMGYRDVISSMSLRDKAVCAECEAEHIAAMSKAWSDKNCRR